MGTYKFFDPEDMTDIAYVKRLMEYQALIPGFADKFNSDPEKILAGYGFSFTPKDVSFGPNTIEDGEIKMHPVYPDTPAQKYARFMDSKLEYRKTIRQACEPSDPRMKKWRARQIARCMIQLGPKSNALIHAPFSIELSDGCSVGCSFCALASGGLKSVFKYTPENAKLFNEIICIAKEIIGDAAGMGTLYFASEPLDNPDYEKFKEDYTKIFGTIPQITTARSTMNIERLHPLLKEINETQKNIYRFSMLSEEMTQQVFKAFSPEELILTELLPQYDEAPSSGLIKSGRGAGEDEYEDTISCVSGFIVNLARGEIKLTTPIWSSKEHPTGEAILETGNFSDAEQFRDLIQKMIKDHMSNIISPDDEIKLEEGLSIEADGKNVVITAKKGIILKMETKGEPDMFLKLFDSLSKGFRTKRDIASELCNMEKGRIIPSELLHFILNRWWGMGLITTRSGRL